MLVSFGQTSDHHIIHIEKSFIEYIYQGTDNY